MKKLCFLVVFLLSMASYGKSIPTPLLYRLSKKILTETQHFMTDNTESQKTAAKPKNIKAKSSKACLLKCQPKKENKIILPVFLHIDKATEPWYDTE